MTDRIQEPPFTIKIELTQGCQLRCGFCGINGIRGPAGKDDRYFYMTPETADRISSEVARLGWKSRWEMTLHGEPSLNPQVNLIVETIRLNCPKSSLMMTSNGGGFLKKPGPLARISELFDAGLNCLCLDDYDDANIVPKIREALGRANRLEFDTYEYPADGNVGNPYHRHKADVRILSFLQDLKQTTAAKKGARNNISNHAGAAGPPDSKYAGKRCARPFRELAIRYDGRLYLCCDAWRDHTKIGSVMDAPLDWLWQSPILNAYRRKLYAGQRDIGECRGCTSRSWRLGLLPDPQGAYGLPPPTIEDAIIIGEAIEGGPMTPPVLREWEK